MKNVELAAYLVGRGDGEMAVRQFARELGITGSHVDPFPIITTALYNRCDPDDWEYWRARGEADAPQ